MNRVLALAGSVIFFAIAFSIYSYVPESQREPNVYYFGFFETFVFVMIYSGPVYLIAGLPVSLLIDQLLKKIKGRLPYLPRMTMYSIAGIIIGFLFHIWMTKNHIGSLSLVIRPLIYGFTAANIFLHLLLLISWYRK
ncbi:hypothetical protein GCM10008986_18380 [Salinibacillus aidingensis]|uniref:ECF-type riboflavin transporter, S component n=1 Tax=Salinibacillus aidingensis TaxID=237684 RepID=A0ABN1B9B1_9BACI